jgi:CBS domain-containing protein
MTDRVQVLALIGSVLFLVFVLELVRRRRLAEEYSALWIVSALALIGISLRRDLLDFAATWLGVYYPPAVLVLMLVAIISVASLSFSVILSRQQRQIDRLIEENAIMAAELRELRWERDASSEGLAIRPSSEASLSDAVTAVSGADIVVDPTLSGTKSRNH